MGLPGSGTNVPLTGWHIPVLWKATPGCSSSSKPCPPALWKALLQVPWLLISQLWHSGPRGEANPCCLRYVLDLSAVAAAKAQSKWRHVLWMEAVMPCGFWSVCISCCWSTVCHWNRCQNCSDLTPKPYRNGLSPLNWEHGTSCWLSIPKGLTRSRFSS